MRLTLRSDAERISTAGIVEIHNTITHFACSLTSWNAIACTFEIYRASMQARRMTHAIPLVRQRFSQNSGKRSTNIHENEHAATLNEIGTGDGGGARSCEFALPRWLSWTQQWR
jgi:hypothetical protein